MLNDIVTELRNALTRDENPWDATLYARAADEIERLRDLVDIWKDKWERAEVRYRGLALLFAEERKLADGLAEAVSGGHPAFKDWEYAREQAARILDQEESLR